nr:extracellular solute-binding protein [Pusillimonas noertemannii]
MDHQSGSTSRRRGARRGFLRTVLSVAMLAAGLGAAPAAMAQSAGIASMADYSGPDRQQKLEEAARKEGELLIYTSATVEDMTVLIDAFEKKYGIKARLWRAGGEKVTQRTLTEARAGRNEVDILETDGIELEALHREGALQPVKSPYQADLMEGAVRPHGDWTATRLNVFAMAYNTDLVKKEELPKTYEDLLDPRWKGRLGIEAEDLDWFATVVGELGEEKGLRLFRDIVEKNGISVRKGHTLLTNLVASGEVPLALTVYNYKAEQLKNKGAPLDWFTIDPAIVRANGVALAKGAPHPNAALLFFDFLLTDGQRILLERNFVTTSKKAQSKLNQMPMKFVDPAVVLDENAKWAKLYDEIFTKRSR